MYHAASGSAFTLLQAIGLAVTAIATFLVAAVVLFRLGLGTTPAVAVALAMLVIVPFAGMRATNRDPRALGLARVHVRYVAAAVLVGASAWYINIVIASLLPLRDTRSLERAVGSESLAVTLLAIAVAPAVCEEVLFRGVLLRGLATRLHAWAAVVATAIAFSLYHANLVQLVPTFTLGLALGLIAQRAGSVLPTMVAHALNNGCAVLLHRGELPWAANEGRTGVIDRHPWLALVGAAALTAGGLALALRRRPA